MDRVLVVTGGGRGIGAATARLAARDGWAVVVNYARDNEAAEAVVRDIEAAGGRAAAIQADVASEADVLRLFEEADRLFGPLSGLVNNAGILRTQMRLESMDAARIMETLAVNVLGTLLCTREAVKRMSTRHGGKGGSIVNLSSVAARLGGPGEYVDYAASKGAIDSFTTGVAKEVALEGIRVNAVRPGLILTDIHASGGEPGRPERLRSAIPMGRPGDAEEVAESVLWLLSDAASYVTGATMDVTGGR